MRPSAMAGGGHIPTRQREGPITPTCQRGINYIGAAGNAAPEHQPPPHHQQPPPHHQPRDFDIPNGVYPPIPTGSIPRVPSQPGCPR